MGLIRCVREIGVKPLRKFRLQSTAKPTVMAASTPQLFFYVNQPKSDYMVVPGISSEARPYIPIGYASKDMIAGDNTWIIPDASPYVFGVLQSKMHMAWTRVISGRIKSDFQYSASIVYNNFPWPDTPSNKQRGDVDAAAQGVLNVRNLYPNATLADLYDQTAMPAELVKAHQRLDKAVEAAYGKNTFKTDAERVAFLSSLYQKYTSLLPAEKEKRSRKKKEATVVEA